MIRRHTHSRSRGQRHATVAHVTGNGLRNGLGKGNARVVVVLLLFAAVAAAAAAVLLPPWRAFAAECVSSNCGTPERSGGGGGGGGAAVFIAMTDRGDTYQFADDFDGDSQEDEFDNCPFVANLDQIDSDGDGVGDACDDCVSDPDPEQMNTDGDAFGDVCDADLDGDGVLNATDNCPRLANIAQIDTDGDGLGNVCDVDDDDDGISDAQDPCPLVANDPSTGALVASGVCDDDVDNDGVESAADNCPGIYNPERDPVSGRQLDSDSDGIGDACDIDRDGDGVPNYADNCANEPNPDQIDRDRDGLGDAGVYGAVAGSCDRSECYVVPHSPACLDPKAAFNVALALATARSDGTVRVGDRLAVLILSNRLRALHQWTARLVAAPRSSRATFDDPVGAGLTENGPQVQGAAHFTVDERGDYSVEVSVELPNGDAMLRTVAKQTVAVTATDDDGDAAASGCDVTGAAQAGTSDVWMWMIALAFALVVMRVGRRSRECAPCGRVQLRR